MPMRLRAITCEVLARPVYLAAARSPNVVDVSLLRQRLPGTPHTLRGLVRADGDSVSAALQSCDLIVLAYGLCGGAPAGIVARDLPVVLPRAHDCISLLLGGRDRDEREFAAHPGTYRCAPDHLERSGACGVRSAGGLVGIGLVGRLLDGDWQGDLLMLQPGPSLAVSPDSGAVRAVAVGSDASANEGGGASARVGLDRA
jgi:hypothetical protein